MFSNGCYNPYLLTEVEAMWSNHVQKVMSFVSLATCSYLAMTEYGKLNNIELSEHGQI
jgi:hypothetical protein